MVDANRKEFRDMYIKSIMGKKIWNGWDIGSKGGTELIHDLNN